MSKHKLSNDNEIIEEEQPSGSKFQCLPVSVSSCKYIPIGDLNPYLSEIIFKGKVVKKSEIIQFSNGSGRLFNATVMDKSGEIKLLAFNDEVSEIF